MPSHRFEAARDRVRVAVFKPIRQENLTDHVYRAIKQRILTQEIEIGTRLRDEELATQLEISRTPVREALMRLHRDGLVDIIPRSGTRVRSFTHSDIDEIYDLRIVLESFAVRKATSRLSDDAIARLRELHEKAETALAAGNSRPALDFDREMHAAIIDACGNTRLQQFMAIINDYVTLFRNLGARTPFHRGFTYRHREIIQALERRDPNAAAGALAEHIETAKRELFRDVRRRRQLQPNTGSGTRHPRHRRR
jgi:DNA-binding GntR family transcriptional regulator